MTTAADSTPDTTTDTNDPAEPTDARNELASRGVRARFGVPVVLLVLAAALAITGAVLLVRAHSLDRGAPSANEAVIDSTSTATVIGQVSTALNSVLSYDYRNPQTAQAAAKRWLTGDAPAQYKVLFGLLQKLAPGQQLTLVAKVSTAGVTSLRGDTATLLVFLDQQSTRASDGQRSVSAAQVQITAVHKRSGWLIGELKPL